MFTKIQFKQFLLLSTVSLLLSSCATSRGVLLTNQEIQTNGAKSYAAKPAKVFTATEDALKALGYQIALSKPDKGLIVTRKLLVNSFAHAQGNAYSATASQIDTYRQYDVKVTSLKGAKTKVVATPSVYINNDNISGEQTWVLDGPSGERTLWKNLFAKVDQML